MSETYPITLRLAHQCEHLGRVTNRLNGCNCPTKWQRECEVHGSCTLERCGTCSDYIPDDRPPDWS